MKNMSFWVSCHKQVKYRTVGPPHDYNNPCDRNKMLSERVMDHFFFFFFPDHINKECHLYYYAKLKFD